MTVVTTWQSLNREGPVRLIRVSRGKRTDEKWKGGKNGKMHMIYRQGIRAFTKTVKMQR